MHIIEIKCRILHVLNSSVIFDTCKMRRLFLAREAKQKLQFFGHVVRGIAGDIVIIVMKEEKKRCSEEAMAGQHQGVGVDEATRNVRRWYNIGPRRGSCFGDGHCPPRNLVGGSFHRRSRRLKLRFFSNFP